MSFDPKDKPRRKKPFRNAKRNKAQGRPGPRPRPERAPEKTHEEVTYLKQLVDNKVPILVKTTGNEEFSGVLEYYDRNFIRLTRRGTPNLFLFKRSIKYLYEDPGEQGPSGA